MGPFSSLGISQAYVFYCVQLQIKQYLWFLLCSYMLPADLLVVAIYAFVGCCLSENNILSVLAEQICDTVEGEILHQSKDETITELVSRGLHVQYQREQEHCNGGVLVEPRKY